MRKGVVCFIIILWIGCHNKVKPYENNLGVKPSVIAGIDTANYTRIEWKDSLKNFGTVQEGQKINIEFRFQNTGTKPLFITEVLPSCGCTVVDYPQQALLPGEGGVVTASFDSKNHPGAIHKSVTVISNTNNGTTHLLYFSGEVKGTKVDDTIKHR